MRVSVMSICALLAPLGWPDWLRLPHHRVVTVAAEWPTVAARRMGVPVT
jgi:hypothetical protein